MNTSLLTALTRLAYAGAISLVLLGIWSLSKMYVVFNPQSTEPATITVSATGDAVGIPDIATMNFSVVEQGDTVAAVTESANTAMNNIVATLKGAGIADEDLQTTGYNLSPRYDYTKNGSGEIIGYSLTQSVTVKVRNLDTIGAVVDAATAAGANDLSSPTFDIDDPESVQTEARAEAFAKAKAKAESLADAADVDLGEIVTFSEDVGGYDPQPYYYAERSLVSDASLAGAAIEVGSQEVNVSVSVTYALNN